MTGKMATCAWLAAVTALMAGCASTGIKRTEKVQSTVKETRTELADAKKSISETLETLNSLQLAGTTLSDTYPEFKKQVKAVTADAKKLKENSIALQKAGQAKFEAWNAQLQEIQDESLRQSSMKRMKEAQAEHEKLLSLIKQAENVMDPFVSNLNDIVKYLDLDLSREGIKSISGLGGPIRKANKSGQKVLEWIDEVTKELARYESKPTS